MNLKHFKLSEFDCKCGCGENKMEPGFLMRLDTARELAGVPFPINSGYRCEEYNETVGGKPGSAHTKGVGADISAPGSRNRYQILKALSDIGFNRFGIDPKYIHVDEDVLKDKDVIWLYKN